ncbi:MAG: hypothetical protein GX078_08640, partial [Clostridiales bacterium]|nr:hypothetical protein [Clostridiales bacterium]
MRIAKKKGFAIVIAILVAMVLLVGCSLSKDRKTEGSDNILVVDKAGTYALGDAYEEVIINVPDVQIEDGSVDSILVAESVGDGDVTLRNVKGNELTLEGGGPNSIIISGDSEIKSVFIERKDGVIRVLIEDNGVVESATVYEGSQDVVFEGNFGEIIIDASDIEVDIKGAEIDTLSVKGKGTTVRVDKKSSVKSATILEGADNSRIVFEGIVEKLTIEAKDCTVDINSTTEFIKIEDSAKNTTINVGENGSVGVINSTISFTLNGKGIINKVVTNSKSNIKGKATVEEVVLLTNSIPAANLGNTGATIKPASSVAKKETEKTDPKSATQIATVKLDSIAITTPATKTVYTVGETLDITGLVVTGTYSDSTTKVETITTVNVTGFNSSAAVANQTLTVTVGGKIATYKVNINKVVVAVSAITVTSQGDVTTVVNGKTLQMGVVVGPEDATNKKVTWFVTNDEGSATIAANGLLTATGVGKVTVKAVAQDGSGKENTKEITIHADLTAYNAALAAVTEANYTTDSWNAYQVVVAANLVTDTDKQTDVDAATNNIIAAQADLVIPVTGISISGDGSVAKDDTLQLTAIVTPSNATNPDVTWSIETGGTGSAIINTDGLLTG